jgi:4-amino-4-deoxy-L-arabinose transferase-like glycosyltransferase
MTVASARRSAAAAELLGDPRAVLAAIVLYLALHFLLRFLVSPTLSLDDAEQSLFSQSLLAGYRFRQPPLYTWLLWGVSRVFGPGLLAHALVRYLFQFACYAFLYLTALRMIGDRRLAALALAGYLLIWDFGVFIHLDLTHTVAVAAMIAASLWLFARAVEAGRVRDFAWLGLALGLGVLAKYNFVLLVGAAVSAAALTPGLRTRLFRRQAWAAVLVALGIVGPYLYWAWGHGYSFGGLTAAVVHSDTAGSDPGGRLLALATAIGKAVEFTLPFGVIAPLVLPAVLTWQPAADPQGYRRFLGLLMIVGIGMLGVAALAFGASHFKARWMHPILMALPVWGSRGWTGPIWRPGGSGSIWRSCFLPCCWSWADGSSSTASRRSIADPVGPICRSRILRARCGEWDSTGERSSPRGIIWRGTSGSVFRMRGSSTSTTRFSPSRRRRPMEAASSCGRATGTRCRPRLRPIWPPLLARP